MSDYTSHPSTAILTAKNVCFNRNRMTILDDISLELFPRQFTTIVGPNGAGKSLLLKILMGLEKPDSGHIKCEAGIKIGYVPQRIHPDAALPINVKTFLHLNLSKKNREILPSLTEDMHICHIMRQPLHVLSGGEMQRVLLTRALLRQPDILFLDEPAQNLDIGGQLEIYKLIGKIHKQQHCTVVMVSHDLHMVMAESDNVICLYHHICCSGKPESITQDPSFTAIFGPEISRMMAVYHHDHDHSHHANHGCGNDDHCKDRAENDG